MINNDTQVLKLLKKLFNNWEKYFLKNKCQTCMSNHLKRKLQLDDATGSPQFELHSWEGVRDFSATNRTK